MRRSAVTHAAGLAAVLALKLFQHGAGADDLAFLLAPACALASLATGYVFVHEAGAGWVSHAHRFIAGPSCAGMTFLIAGFAAFYFPFVARFERGAHGRLAPREPRRGLRSRPSGERPPHRPRREALRDGRALRRGRHPLRVTGRWGAPST